MLNHSAGSRLLDDFPIPFLLFELIRNLHRGAGGCAGLGTEADVGGGLVILNRDIREVGVHRLEIQGAERRKMLADGGANRLVVAWLLLASGDEEQHDTSNRHGKFKVCDFHSDLRLYFIKFASADGD